MAYMTILSILFFSWKFGQPVNFPNSPKPWGWMGEVRCLGPGPKKKVIFLDPFPYSTRHLFVINISTSFLQAYKNDAKEDKFQVCGSSVSPIGKTKHLPSSRQALWFVAHVRYLNAGVGKDFFFSTFVRIWFTHTHNFFTVSLDILLYRTETLRWSPHAGRSKHFNLIWVSSEVILCCVDILFYLTNKDLEKNCINLKHSWH